MEASYGQLAELLGKGEIPAAILKYCFAGSLFISDRRVTLFPGFNYSARRDKILLKARVFHIDKRKWWIFHFDI